jgi:hypothetical protein
MATRGLMLVIVSSEGFSVFTSECPSCTHPVPSKGGSREGPRGLIYNRIYKKKAYYNMDYTTRTSM